MTLDEQRKRALANTALRYCAYNLRVPNPKPFAEWADNEVIALVQEATKSETNEQLEVC